MILCVMLPVCAFTQHEHIENHSTEHLYHHHHTALFLGAATNIDIHHSAFTFGAEYEFRFIKQLGIGVFGELITGEEKETVIGIPIVLHPMGGLKLIAAPLLVFISEHNPIEPKSEIVSHTETGFRACAMYDIHLGKYTVSPDFSADFINGHTTLVYGVAFGIGF